MLRFKQKGEEKHKGGRRAGVEQGLKGALVFPEREDGKVAVHFVSQEPRGRREPGVDVGVGGGQDVLRRQTGARS